MTQPFQPHATLSEIKNPLSHAVRGGVDLTARVTLQTEASCNNSNYIIGFESEAEPDSVMDLLTIVAVDAIAAKAVNMATAANSFAKFCTFIQVPPALILLHLS
ncbi:MAG: hypothetical protein M0T70_16010 [Geobacteraceae bacterium]|nr:hypothetical protein [Geobacteraceae bacterium]